MENPNKLIYKFNNETKLLDQGYLSKRECAFPIEEMLEGLHLETLAEKLDAPNVSPKELSRIIIGLATEEESNIEPVDILDKHVDAIIYNFGSLFKLGLTPQEANKALTIVATANMQKLHAGRDQEGKQLKPSNFIPPETQLQKIIDEVNKRQAASNS